RALHRDPVMVRRLGDLRDEEQVAHEVDGRRHAVAIPSGAGAINPSTPVLRRATGSHGPTPAAPEPAPALAPAPRCAPSPLSHAPPSTARSGDTDDAGEHAAEPGRRDARGLRAPSGRTLRPRG